MAQDENDEMSAEDIWRWALTETHFGRFAYLPSESRCTVCSTPFAGIAGGLARLTGWRVSQLNPHMCNFCEEKLPVGGAEVDIAVLFADVRGSTQLGASMSSREFVALLNRFYETATKTLVRHRAVIDKLIGDEVMAFFIQANDPDPDRLGYRRGAVEAAIDLMKAVGYKPGSEPWLPLAIGVHAGEAYVGRVGFNDSSSFTVLGDMVNTAAALRSEARAGEVLISEELFQTVATQCRNAEPRQVTLKGRTEPVLAYSLRTVPVEASAS